MIKRYRSPITHRLARCAARAVLSAAIISGVSYAQTPTSSETVPFGIIDNSFLVEEAFNQEPGVFQNIVNFVRERSGTWAATFTQEWPLPNMTHQLSYTVPLARMNGATGFGDVLVNYRWQAFTETAMRPAFSPRLSVILPTGARDTGFGEDALGWQVNLPFSKQIGSVYFHWNAGFTYTPRASVEDATASRKVALFDPSLAGSAIWQATPLLDLLLELTATSDQQVEAQGQRQRDTSTTVSPGVRRGWNLGDQQIVVGAAAPVTWTKQDTDVALLLYFSYELPFLKK